MPDDRETGVRLLRDARSILVIDWPSRDVPVALARAGIEVTVRGGPSPADYSVYEAGADEVTVRKAGAAPGHVDLVYCYRPLEELEGITEMARSLGARAVWRQSGLSPDGSRDPAGCWVPAEESRQARSIVEAVGLVYVEEPYIYEAARELGG
jgi:hypothetical protein